MINKNYMDVIRIRAFEELILDLFGQNKLSGTTHTYIGEEATAVAIMRYVNNDDKVFSNHRCHGHYLAYGGPEDLLLAEIMSKSVGLCQGRGGSQHIHYKNFYTNGIQGGIVPNAVGVAFADKHQHKTGNTIVFLGDGTLGQGVVYESLNIASVYEIPVVFVVEDNQYAMSTRRTDVIAGDIKKRIEGFNIKTFEIESTDVDELEAFFEKVFTYINSERKPVCAVVHNYRLGAHSKGDDTRDPKEIALHKENDPISLIQKKVGIEKYEMAYNEIRSRLEAIVNKLDDEQFIEVNPIRVDLVQESSSIASEGENRYVESIREAFRERLHNDSKTIFLGEDICDPYGGAFKATKGLSEEYKNQLYNMPISEAGMTGLAVGMAMNGLIPVVEMMFGDFVTLGFDQLLNHASKYAWVYGNNMSLPMVVRTPMGAKRGYGPTHSQSLEKFLIGIPGIKVLALSLILNPKLVYKKLFQTIKEPTVIVENKKMYGQKSWAIEGGYYKEFEVKEINNYGFSSFVLSIDADSLPDCYAIAYGGMDEDVLSASYELMMSEEIQMDVILISQLSPLPIKDIMEAVRVDVPIITVEEGTITSGIGAEIITRCVENGISSRYCRIASPDMPIPNGIVLEEQIVPDKNVIVQRVKEFIMK